MVKCVNKKFGTQNGFEEVQTSYDLYYDDNFLFILIFSKSIDFLRF